MLNNDSVNYIVKLIKLKRLLFTSLVVAVLIIALLEHVFHAFCMFNHSLWLSLVTSSYHKSVTILFQNEGRIFFTFSYEYSANIFIVLSRVIPFSKENGQALAKRIQFVAINFVIAGCC